MKSRPANSGEEMMAFVSEDTPDETGETRLYLRFDERKKVYKQLEALADHFEIPLEKLKRNNDLTAYVEGTIPAAFVRIIKTGLRLPEGKFTYILSSILRDNPGTNGNVISVVLILFSVFIISSIYRISLAEKDIPVWCIKCAGDWWHTSFSDDVSGTLGDFFDRISGGQSVG